MAPWRLSTTTVSHLFPFRQSRVQHYERNLLQEISKKRLARCRVVVTADAFPGEELSTIYTPRGPAQRGHAQYLINFDRRLM